MSEAIISSPEPTPKRRGKARVWGLVSVCLIWLALGAHTDTASAQINFEIDWLVGSAVSYIPAGSESLLAMTKVVKTKLLMIHNQENADHAVPRPFPFLSGWGLGTRLGLW